jgi:hypothetical protein
MQKQTIFMKAIGLLESEPWKARFAKALKDETSCTDVWVLINLKSSLGQLIQSMSLGATICGKAFPSASAPGGQVIVQRKPHGVM